MMKESFMVAANLTQKLMDEIAKLPAEEQQTFAAWALEELDERRWQKRFAETQDQLKKLAQEALRAYEAGETKELDPDTL
jgi:hypothetical protein